MALKLLYKLILFVVVVFFAFCRPSFDPPAFKETVIDFDKDSIRETYLFMKDVFVEKETYAGKYAGKINNHCQFGYIYKSTLKKVSPKKIKWIKYSSILKKLSGNVQVSAAICEIKDSTGFTLQWLTVPLKSRLIERDVWTRVDARFDISKYNKPSYTVALFIWNCGSFEEVLQDEIEIKYFD